MFKTFLKTTFAAALLAGCAESDPGPVEAERADAITRVATVQTVDPKTREILLTEGDGRAFVIIAGPEVRNFDQLESGDKVSTTYFEAVAVQMAASDDPGGGVTVNAAERAEEGAKPGLVAGQVSDFVVEFLDYNPESHIATFIGPNNVVQRTVVRPEMREFAAARKPGERVQVTVEQALAISVSEIAG
ncbi:MAG: hypothetical protein AAGD47_16095 [Pseudomonadota bacterium]